MDVCTETFATLINFMTSINWSMQHLTKFWRGLRQSDVHVKGGHFEHLIWFKSTHMLMFISKSVRCWVKYIKRIAIVDLLYFLVNLCSDTSKVRWEIWHDPCRKFTAESNSYRIFKIGQHFSKLWTNKWHVFMAHSVENNTITFPVSQIPGYATVLPHAEKSTMRCFVTPFISDR